MRGVLTISVSSSPCSSPTCERAGNPAGPVRTDKIVSSSHICHASQYFSFFLYKWTLNIFHLGKWMCLSESLTLLHHWCIFQCKWLRSSSHTQPVISKLNIVQYLPQLKLYVVYREIEGAFCYHPRYAQSDKLRRTVMSLDITRFPLQSFNF